MPIFKLEEPKHVKRRPQPRVIFTKHEYNEKVKMPLWEGVWERYPKDNDPYSPPGGNVFLSTYKRLGHLVEKDHFLTTTHESLEAADRLRKNISARPVREKWTVVDRHKLREAYSVLVDTKEKNPYELSSVSTMQENYKIPYTADFRPVTIPATPFLKYRKFVWEEPKLDRNKFYDDCYQMKIRNLQNVKGFFSKSYDPIAQRYTDGTELKTKKNKCYELPYNTVK